MKYTTLSVYVFQIFYELILRSGQKQLKFGIYVCRIWNIQVTNICTETVIKYIYKYMYIYLTIFLMAAQIRPPRSIRSTDKTLRTELIIFSGASDMNSSCYSNSVPFPYIFHRKSFTHRYTTIYIKMLLYFLYQEIFMLSLTNFQSKFKIYFMKTRWLQIRIYLLQNHRYSLTYVGGFFLYSKYLPVKYIVVDVPKCI